MATPKNIFILSNRLTHGGAERVASNLADGLADVGHQVHLYVNKDEVETYKPKETVHLCYYPNVRESRSFWMRQWRLIMFIRAEIKKQKPHVIIGIMWYYTFVAKVAQWLSGLRIPVVYSDHNSLERPDVEPMASKEYFFKFYFSRMCDAYTVLTDADRIYGEKKGLKNIVVMPNPLGIEPVKTVPQKEKIILAVGRLDAWVCKGWDILLEAWCMLVPKHPTWKLYFAGAGSDVDKQRLISFSQENNVEEHIKIIDYTKDVASLYQRAAIVVSSSRYEGFGLVLIEAMSQGCACVAADYKGRQSEIIHDGSDGLLCEVENPMDLAKKMDVLLSDECWRATLQRNALQSVSRFSLQNYAKRWENLFEQLIIKR